MATLLSTKALQNMVTDAWQKLIWGQQRNMHVFNILQSRADGSGTFVLYADVHDALEHRIGQASMTG